MKLKTFVLFAAEAISENMNYLADPDDGAETDGSLDQIDALMQVVRTATLEGMTEAELDDKAEELMYYNITAWADSNEFKLHELANSWFDEQEAK